MPPLNQKVVFGEEETRRETASASACIHFPGRVYWIKQPLVQAAIQTMAPHVRFWHLAFLVPSKDRGGQGAGQSDLLKFVPRSSGRGKRVRF